MTINVLEVSRPPQMSNTTYEVLSLNATAGYTFSPPLSAVNRNGNPLPASHHHCPDCLPLIALDATPATAPATPHRLVAPVVPVPPTSASIARLLLQPPARGPPAFSVV